MLFSHKNRLFMMLCLFPAILFLAGCSEDNVSGNISGGRDVMRLPGVATAGRLNKEEIGRQGILAVVTAVDVENQKITLKVIGERTVELSYTGASDVRNEIKEVIAISQVAPGEVVYADYDAASKKLKGLMISPDEWKRTVSGMKTDTDGAYILMDGEKYTYDDHLVIISDNMKCNIADIKPIDQLLIKGRERKIDSIVVIRGHGYLQLKNTAYYEDGGIIEVGREVITGITGDMKLLVPEGTYRLTVTKGKESGSKEITIDRNQELEVSLSEFQKDGGRYGNIGFEITPENAQLYIDNKKIKDYTKMVELPYGQHEIEVRAEGYKTYTGVIAVDDLYQPFEVVLEEEETTSAIETEEKETSREQETTKKKETETTTEEITTINLTDIVKDILLN